MKHTDEVSNDKAIRSPTRGHFQGLTIRQPSIGGVPPGWKPNKVAIVVERVSELVDCFKLHRHFKCTATFEQKTYQKQHKK